MGIKLSGLCNLSAVVLWAGLGLATAHADPRGLWLAQDGSKVLVNPCGTALCGTLESTEPPTDPATGRPPTDKNNPDQARRNRPLVGVVILISMTPDGPGKWAGHLYNVDSGETLPGHLLEIDGRTIRIEGCTILCGGQNMSRIH